MDTTSSAVRRPGTLLADLLAEHAAHQPEREALRFRATRLTWAELHDRVMRCAAALQSEGVGPGDRVALLDLNHTAAVELTLACAQVGAVLVPLNFQLATAELEHVVADTSATVLFAGHLLAPILTDDPDRHPGVRRVIVIGGLHDDYEAWLDTDAVLTAHTAAPEDTVLALYSCAPGGFPEAALLTHAEIIGNARVTSTALNLNGHDCALVATPLSQVAAISAVMIQLYLGGRTVIMRVPAPLAICQTLHEERITHTFLAPALLGKIVRQAQLGEFDYSALRVVGYGASPMPVSTLRACLKAFPHVVVQIPGDADPHRLLPVGKPFAHARTDTGDRSDH